MIALISNIVQVLDFGEVMHSMSGLTKVHLNMSHVYHITVLQSVAENY